MPQTIIHVAVRLGLFHVFLGQQKYRLQHVVEVVGDASGDPAQGLHLLGLHQFLFGLTMLGDVLNGSTHPDHIPGGIENHLTALMYDANSSVRKGDAVNNVVRFAFLRLVNSLFHLCPVIWMHAVEKGVEGRRELLGI